MSFRINHQSVGSNIVQKPIEVKKIRVGSYNEFSSSDQEVDKLSSSSEQTSDAQVEEKQLTDVERRAKRREEFRDAAAIRERALKMERQAQQKIKETEQFNSLMYQAKDDPLVLAKALNMDPSEFQRKIFNKMYSIQEDEPAKEQEESFEEQTKKRLDEYERERAEERERAAQESRQNAEANMQKIKHNYITDKIMPHINETHELIHQNDKYSCAALAYDLMNQLYQDHCSKGGTEEDFDVSPKDVLDQMEEELYKRTEEQLSKAKNISKLKKYFAREDAFNDSNSISRKSFAQRRTEPRSMTLSHSMGGATPAAVSSSQSHVSDRKVSIRDRSSRLARAQRVLGQ